MTKRIIGLFCPVDGTDLRVLFNILSSIGEVRLICVGQTNLGPIDILVLPDGMGILPNIQALVVKSRSFIPSAPINPHFLMFWEDRILSLLEDRGELRIIGMGDAAAMLYSLAGGKIFIDHNGKGQMFNLNNPETGLNVKNDITIIGPQDDYFIEGFRYENYAGVQSYGLLKETLFQMFKDIDDELSREDDESGPVSPINVPRSGKNN